LQDLYYLKHIHPEIYNSHACFAQTVSKIQANLAQGSIDRNKQGFNDQIIKEALEAANIKYEQSFEIEPLLTFKFYLPETKELLQIYSTDS